MELIYYVYVITDPRDSQPFYVGKGKGHRITQHERTARKPASVNDLPHIVRIRELLELGMVPMYEKVLFNVSEQAALLKEEQLIDGYGRQWNGTGCLLNTSRGGKPHGITERAVSQYSLDGHFIKTFKSALVAGEETTANQSYITQCCKGKRRSSGGFLWAYQDAPAPTFTKQYYRAVHQFSINGDLVATYRSLTEAQNATGIELHNISEACRGNSKTAGGYVWKYV